MQPGIQKTLLGIAAFISLMLGMLVASVMMPRELTAQEADELGYYRLETPRQINAFVMTDHHGQSVGVEKLKGKWSILFFGFTFCPDVCPTTLSVLSSAVSDLKNAPQVIMVSVDPERDTPVTLARYVTAFNASFIGYSGTFDETVNLAEQVNVAFGKVPGMNPELILSITVQV